jgi:hypothetical protein
MYLHFPFCLLSKYDAYFYSLKNNCCRHAVVSNLPFYEYVKTTNGTTHTCAQEGITLPARAIALFPAR